MSIKNTKLGGTNWGTNEKVTSTDLNDTFSACNTYISNSQSYALAPVGSIMAYHISFIAGTGLIPEGWKDCDGTVITDAASVYNGQTAPKLNGTTDDDSLFLRGNPTSGTTGGSSTHGHSISDRGQIPGANVYHALLVGSSSNVPNYFNVRWIMRIK